VIGNILLLLVVVLFGALGAHHFIKARRGLRTGVVEGLMIGNAGKRYSREDDAGAFWNNIFAGFAAASCGGILVLWAASLILISILVSFGFEGWP
jgi:hypothetical protein